MIIFGRQPEKGSTEDLLLKFAMSGRVPDRPTEGALVKLFEGGFFHGLTVEQAAAELGATPAEGWIPGLWTAPGYPELTTAQLLDAARQKRAGQ